MQTKIETTHGDEAQKRGLLRALKRRERIHNPPKPRRAAKEVKT